MIEGGVLDQFYHEKVGIRPPQDVDLILKFLVPVLELLVSIRDVC